MRDVDNLQPGSFPNCATSGKISPISENLIEHSSWCHHAVVELVQKIQQTEPSKQNQRTGVSDDEHAALLQLLVQLFRIEVEGCDLVIPHAL